MTEDHPQHMVFSRRGSGPPSRSPTVGSHYCNCLTRETAATGRDDSVRQKPELDGFGREYARLSFGIERHVPGFIDAYLGPDNIRAALDPEDPAGVLPMPAALVTAARDLLAKIPSLDATEGRKGYLTKQVEA